VETSKRLFDSERNLRDMRLVREPEAIFPVNWFSETSNSCCYPIFDTCFDKFSEKFKNSEKH
jgi:hypothetical protein